MRTILLRLGDLLSLSFIMSPIFCALFYYRVFDPAPETMAKAQAITLALVTVVFIICNVLMLRRCFFEIKNRKIYYIFNYSAYAIFILLTVVAFFVSKFVLKTEVPYAWMFSVLKLAKFLGLTSSTLVATAMMHFVMLIVIALAPIGMGWVLEFEAAKERSA